jgi:hypothetical protein
MRFIYTSKGMSKSLGCALYFRCALSIEKYGITKTPTHYKPHTYTHPYITKQDKTTTVQVKTTTLQVKTTTVQVKTTTVQDKTNTIQDRTTTVQVKTTTVQVKANTVQDIPK